ARTIRAYDPRPGAVAATSNGEVKLFGGRLAPTLPSRGGVPGEVLEVGDGGMIVACGAGTVSISAVHPAGKRRITPAEWARGGGGGGAGPGVGGAYILFVCVGQRGRGPTGLGAGQSIAAAGGAGEALLPPPPPRPRSAQIYEPVSCWIRHSTVAPCDSTPATA